MVEIFKKSPFERQRVGREGEKGTESKKKFPSTAPLFRRLSRLRQGWGGN